MSSTKSSLLNALSRTSNSSLVPQRGASCFFYPVQAEMKIFFRGTSPTQWSSLTSGSGHSGNRDSNLISHLGIGSPPDEVFRSMNLLGWNPESTQLRKRSIRTGRIGYAAVFFCQTHSSSGVRHFYVRGWIIKTGLPHIVARRGNVTMDGTQSQKWSNMVGTEFGVITSSWTYCRPGQSFWPLW